MTETRRQPMRWLRKLGHAAAAAGVAGIAALLAVFVYALATGPAVSAGEALALFVAIMPAAVFAPILGTLPVLALGIVTQRSWRGPPPLAIWALAGAAFGLVSSLLLAARGATSHLPVTAFGAIALPIFGYLEREVERTRG
jgi:hypothetical protein